MDAFEEIVAGLFRTGLFEGKRCWTWINYKVNLTRDQKQQIGTGSMPRTEIDILGFHPQSNSLLWIECKSYLDSRGVNLNQFVSSHGEKYGGVPKVFATKKKRDIISKALSNQVSAQGLVSVSPTLYYCFVAGHVAGLKPGDFERYAAYFIQMDPNFRLFGPDQIREHIQKKLSARKVAYENDVAVMMAKLLGRA